MTHPPIGRAARWVGFKTWASTPIGPPPSYPNKKNKASEIWVYKITANGINKGAYHVSCMRYCKSTRRRSLILFPPPPLPHPHPPTLCRPTKRLVKQPTHHPPCFCTTPLHAAATRRIHEFSLPSRRRFFAQLAFHTSSIRTFSLSLLFTQAHTFSRCQCVERLPA